MIKICTCFLLYVSVGFATKISVAIGRSVALETTDLIDDVHKTSECRVTVDDNEASAQRVGYVNPKEFPCAFRSGAVTYQHHGSKLLTNDVVRFTLVIFNNSTSFTRNVALDVNIKHVPYDIVTTSFPFRILTVAQFYGRTANIAALLNFKYSTQHNETCQVVYDTAVSRWPAKGQLIDGDGPAAQQLTAFRTDCDDFRRISSLYYSHRYPPSPDIDFIPLKVEVANPIENTLRLEYVQLAVRIHGAIPNEPPRPALMGSYILEVRGSTFVKLPEESITVSDLSSDNDIVFNLTSEIAEKVGFFAKLPQPTVAIWSFRQSELRKGLIGFVPSVTDTEKIITTVFEVIDEYMAKSDPVQLHIVVLPALDFGDFISVAQNLIILEKTQQPLTWSLFNLETRARKADVWFYLNSPLLHGSLVKNGKDVTTFTRSDLDLKAVSYRHNGKTGRSDTLDIRASFGTDVVYMQLGVQILTVDSRPPYLVQKRALKTIEGGSEPITRKSLLAVDDDSSSDQILFVLTSTPRGGILVKKFHANSIGKPIVKFSQSEIDNGYIYYNHLKPFIYNDQLDFILNDGSHFNHTVNHLRVSIKSLKELPPYAAEGLSFDMSVKETEISVLSKKQLQYKDRDSKNGKLAYRIIRQPFFVGDNNFSGPSVDAGRLISIDDDVGLTSKSAANAAVTAFTQFDLNHNKIAYQPPLADVGTAPRSVQFTFEVADPGGNKVSNQAFNIHVQPVNNQAPKLKFADISVEEGGHLSLTDRNIIVADADTPLDDLTIRLEAGPKHGNLSWQVGRENGALVKPTDKLTIEDLHLHRIRYTHDGSETASDAIRVTVNDIAHTTSDTLQIRILPVNDQLPELLPQSTLELDVDEGATAVLDSAVVSVDDADTGDEDILFTLVEKPQKGGIFLDGAGVDVFSQADIASDRITYQHNGIEIGLGNDSDRFSFTITDRRLPGIGVQPDASVTLAPAAPSGQLALDRSTDISQMPTHTVNVNIRPVNNMAPQIFVQGQVMVDEGSRVQLTSQMVKAFDEDTGSGSLVFHVSTPPQWGVIEKIDKGRDNQKIFSRARRKTVTIRGSAMGAYEVDSPLDDVDRLTQFSMAELEDGLIWYTQERSRGVEPTRDSVEFYVTDGKKSSPKLKVVILIRPVNDESPLFEAKEPIRVVEGGTVDFTYILRIAIDLDIPLDTLTFEIAREPKFGVVRLLQPGGATLKLGQHPIPLRHMTSGKFNVTYEHNGGDDVTDDMVVLVSDGMHRTSTVVSIEIEPVNDQRPVVIKNAPLNVNYGENSFLSHSRLTAVDKDNTSSQLWYSIVELPRKGAIEKFDRVIWQPLAVGANFTQEDIFDKRVRYAHTDDDFTEWTDRAIMNLTDGKFSISSIPLNVRIRWNVNVKLALFLKTLIVNETDAATITNETLRAIPIVFERPLLDFYVTKPPKYGALRMHHGGAMVNVHMFTSIDLGLDLVKYVHKGAFGPLEDSFSFRVVMDGQTVKNGTLDIRILPIDTNYPVLERLEPIAVLQGAPIALKASKLSVSHHSLNDSELLFEVVKPPRRGKLMRGDSVATSFTQADLKQRKVMFFHDGSFGDDQFSVNVIARKFTGVQRDGVVTFDPLIVHLNVVSGKNHLLKLTQNTPPSLVVPIDDEFGFTFNTLNLDVENNGEEVVYTVKSADNGAFLVGDNRTATSFTQTQLELGEVRYVITNTAPAKDVIVLRAESGSESIDEIAIPLQWSVIEFDRSAELVTVCERDRSASIKVRRRGFSGESAYVSIKARGGKSSRNGWSYRAIGKQLNFDRGVDEIMWPIDIDAPSGSSSASPKRVHTFRVILWQPVYAVLGAADSIRVRLLPSEHNECKDSHLTQKDRPSVRSSGSHPLSYASAPNDETTRRRSGEASATSIGANWLNASRNKVAAAMTPLLTKSLLDTRQAPCNKATKGLIHFDDDTRNLFKCDGSFWLPWTSDQFEAHTTCPRGWSSHTSKCYKLFSRRDTWEGAEQTCRKQHESGHLASVQSRKQLQWLWRLSGASYFWIGLRAEEMIVRQRRNRRRKRQQVAYNWKHTSAEPLVYTHWRQGYPKLRTNIREGSKKSVRACVLVHESSQWVNRSCAKTRARFICMRNSL